MKNKVYTTLFIIAAIILTLYMPLRLHHSLTKQNAGSESSIYASTFYNDAFYYLTVADNYSKTGLSTYDGTNLTNGYNFLWQNILNVALSGADGKANEIKFTFILSILLALAAYSLLFLIVFGLTKSRFLALFAIFPGFFYLFFSTALGIHYSPWSIINGMESSLDVLLFAALLGVGLKYVQGTLSEKAFFTVSSFLLAMLFLARYDEIFLLAAFVFIILKYEQSEKTSKLLYVASLPAVFVIILLLYNKIQFGLFLPVSGLLKSSFTFDNILHVFNSLLTGRSFDYIAGEHLFARLLPLLVPLIFVPLFSNVIEKEYEGKNSRLIMITRILKYYVIFKSLYILFFVGLWQQGYWYFYNQVIIFNILSAVVITLKAPGILKSRIFYTFVIIVVIYFSHSYFLNFENDVIKSGKLSKSNVERIGDLLKQNIPAGKIVEMDDGIIAFSSDNQCLSGFGLCIDKQGYEAIKKGKLLELAYKRGYRYLASVNYFKGPELIPDRIYAADDFLKTPFFALSENELSKWKYSVLIKDRTTNLIVIQFNKK